MKRLSVIALSILIMCATLGSVLVFAAPNNGKLVVGALKDTKPYSTNSDKADEQMLTYCIEQMPLGSGVEYKYYDSYVAMLTDLGKGNISIAFPVAKYGAAKGEFGIEMSDVLVPAEVSVVFKGTYSDRTTNSLAVDTNSIMYYYAQAVFPESTKVFCDSQEDCVQAVIDGRASCTMISDIKCSSLKATIEDNGDLDYTSIPFGMDVCFAVKQGSNDLLNNINAGIASISSSELSKRVYNIQDNTKKSVKEKVKAIGIIGKVLIALAILLVIFGAIYLMVIASRKRVVQDRLSKQNQMLREAKIRQDEFAAITLKRKKELRELETEIGEKIREQKEQAAQLKEETENLQIKNEDMQSQTETLENLLLEKYVQMEEFEKKIADYNQRIEEYDQQIEDYGKLEDYQKQLEQDILDKMEMLGYEDLELEKIGIRTAIKEIIPDIKSMAAASSVDFSLEIDEMQNPVVICDREKLNKMTLDMLFVAIRNSNPETKVTLNIHQVGEGGGFAYFDYTCIFTGDTLDYSSHVTTNLRGVSKLQRMENGTTSIIISLRLPIMKGFMKK